MSSTKAVLKYSCTVLFGYTNSLSKMKVKGKPSGPTAFIFDSG